MLHVNKQYTQHINYNNLESIPPVNSQNGPSYPKAHEQVNPPVPGLHAPPLRQFLSRKKSIPVKTMNFNPNQVHQILISRVE